MKLKNEFFYYITCFTTGFAILVFELLSFRMLAPYFGNSSIVIGTIINSILLALAVGYYLGGFIADKKKSSTLIYHVIIISSFYIKSYCIMCVGSWIVNFALLYLFWLIRRRYEKINYLESLKNDFKFWKTKKSVPPVIFVFFLVAITLITLYPKYWHYELQSNSTILNTGVTVNSF